MIGNYQQLTFSFIKPSLGERLTGIYLAFFQASRLLAQTLLFGFSLLRFILRFGGFILRFGEFIFWSAILLVLSIPYQIWTAFIPRKNGSLPISKFLRRVFEHQRIKTTIGLALIIIIPFTNLLSGQVSAFSKPEEQTVVLDEPKEVLITTQTTFRIPVPGYISTGFSWYHPGIDIAGNDDRLVYAAAEGTVIEASYSNWGYGNTIVIDHGGGLTTRYAHLQKDIRVKVGDKVSKNDALGRVGSTGWSTGPHIHYEVRVNGTRVNPLDYIK